MDDSVMEDAYSIPWRGNKSLHKQQSKDGQQSRGTDSRHKQNKEGGDHVDQSTTASQVNLSLTIQGKEGSSVCIVWPSDIFGRGGRGGGGGGVRVAFLGNECAVRASHAF